MAFNFQKIGERILNACNPDPSKAGKTLLVLNAAGMIAAAASNTFAAAVDKNTSAEDKKFLVPAGLATGVANIGLYYAMTDKMIKSLKNSADTFVSSMEASDIAKNATELAKKTITKAETGFLGTGLFKKPKELVSSMKSTLFKDGIIDVKNITDDAIALYKNNTKAAAGVLGAFAGAVIGCAVLTPIIRDVSAYFIQKRMEKNNPDLREQPHRPYFDPTHLKINGVNKPMNMKNYMAFTQMHGNMKI